MYQQNIMSCSTQLEYINLTNHWLSVLITEFILSHHPEPLNRDASVRMPSSDEVHKQSKKLYTVLEGEPEEVKVGQGVEVNGIKEFFAL